MILENKNKKSNTLNTSPEHFNAEVAVNRKEQNHENLSEKFMCSSKDFTKQFAHIYGARLQKMKQRLVHAATAKWGSSIPICKLSELSDESNDKCIVIGTLFKHQELKPSILKEISEENQIMPQPFRSNYVSETDQLILEDEIQRIRLVGNVDVKKLVTGIMVGLLGFENQNGKFEVEDICFSSVEVPEIPLTVNEDCYLVMVSGLSIGNIENIMALELLVDWIRGDLGSIPEQENCAKISRLLIAGNSVIGSHVSKNSHVINTEIEDNSDTLTGVKNLDNLLLELVKSIEVDIMPGEFDPSNHNLPQQAIHDCIFPKSSQYKSFHSVTNPYECVVGGRIILGTSGQPIADIKTLSDMDNSLDVLEKTLQWGHLAPTAPDTLPCYPYYKEDPFIITQQPDIYFAGNQPKLETKLLNLNGHSTRLICIPSFSETQTAVIVNLKTLECNPLTITM